MIRAAVRALRKIQYNIISFIIYNIIYYIIFIIYYLSDSPSSLVTESVCFVGKGRLKERCGLEPRTNFFFHLRNRQKLVRIRFGCGLDSRIYGTFYTSQLLILRQNNFSFSEPWIVIHESEKDLPYHTYRCDDTRGCIIQFWPPDDEHMVLETCRGMK